MTLRTSTTIALGFIALLHLPYTRLAALEIVE